MADPKHLLAKHKRTLRLMLIEQKIDCRITALSVAIAALDELSMIAERMQAIITFDQRETDRREKMLHQLAGKENG